MAMFRYGHASVVHASITSDDWTNKVYKGACKNGQCRMKTARSIIAKYSPDKYLLSHCSIIAAVDTDLADPKDPKSDYLIKPEFSPYVNNNGDAWTKEVLKNSYQTFIGGESYLEHVQISELSKGKIIDAVLREISIGKDKEGKELSTYYVDILVATDRKHEDLVRKIESKELNSLSMGCFLSGTEITMSDGSKHAIETLKPGDMVITHNGIPQPIMNIQKKWYVGTVLSIKVEGNFKETYVTPEHPFWGFKRELECACGCGEKIHTKLTGYKNNFDGKNFVFSKYKLGHYARVVNPNKKTHSLEEYRDLKENNSIKGKLDLSWVKAGDLKEGDLVSYPISDNIINNADATIDKARLIGYFLSEGSFIKEMIVQGEETDFGVKCRICGNIYNKLDTHLPVHKINSSEYKKLYPNAPLNAKIHKQLIRIPRKKSIQDETGYTRSQKKIGAEFSLGKHEYDTINKEIVELSEKVFPGATILRYSDCVKIIGENVAKFFLKYCGEYCYTKQVPEEILFWPKEIQKHIIATWILGNYASTSSKNLFNQMHYMFIRNRVWHNQIYVGEAAPYKKMIHKRLASGEIVSEVHEGFRQEAFMLQLVPSSFNAVKDELRYSFDYQTPHFKNLTNLTTNSWKNVQQFNWLTRKITKIEEISYEGWIYNFEVDKDNSYIANDIAVHNCLIKFSICSKCGNRAIDETQACDHIRYQKNNTFFDDHGVQRKIAELCGCKEELDSVRFIEASWVAQPAFTGAVLRSFVAPSEEIMAKLEKAEKMETYKKKPGDYLKAAGLSDIIAQEPAEKEEPKDEPPADEPPADEAPADEAPADDPLSGEEGIPEGMEEDEFKSWKKDLKKQVLKQIGDEVLKSLSEEEAEFPRGTDTLDETLIRPASLVLHKVWGAQKTWDRFVRQTVGTNLDKKSFDKLRYGLHIAMTNSDLTALKDYGYNKRDFLAVLSFIDGRLKKAFPLQVKKTIAKIGGLKDKDPKEILAIVVKDLGRKITRDEARKVLSWLRLMDYYKN